MGKLCRCVANFIRAMQMGLSPTVYAIFQTIRNDLKPQNFPMTRDQPNSRGKMHDFMTAFLKCVKFHRKFAESFENSRAPTDVISKCCADANEKISEQRIFTTLSQDSRQSRVTVQLRLLSF